MNTINRVKTVAVSIALATSMPLVADQISGTVSNDASGEAGFARWAATSDAKSLAGHSGSGVADSLADLKSQRDVRDYSYKFDASSDVGAQARWGITTETVTLAGHPDAGMSDSLADLKHSTRPEAGQTVVDSPDDLEQLPATAAGADVMESRQPSSVTFSPYAARDYGDATARDKRLLHIGQND